MESGLDVTASCPILARVLGCRRAAPVIDEVANERLQTDDVGSPTLTIRMYLRYSERRIRRDAVCRSCDQETHPN